MGTTYLYGRDIAAEVESYWMVPLLVESETDKVMSWQLALSLWSTGSMQTRSPRASNLKRSSRQVGRS